MKKVIFAAIAFLLLAGCSSEDNEELRVENDELSEVTLTFSPYTMEAMTRASASISEYCSRLDIWLYEGENELTSFQQQSSDEGFGSVSLTLNIQKEYTIYAVAHKANGSASITDGIISFPEDKITHSFFVKHTFTPTKGMNINLTMNRIVSQFYLTTTDAVPEWCISLRFTFYGVFDRWDVDNGGVHQVDRVSTINLTSLRADNTVGCTLYNIVAGESTNHNILIEGLDANGDVQESHTLNNVPLRNNYRTIAEGYFFSDAASTLSFVAEEWSDDLDFDF